MSEMHDGGFSEHYDEASFFDKAMNFAKMAGSEVVMAALKLYYASQSPSTPAWAKAICFSALGYFILPLDAIPDLVPGVGYTDDLGVLAAAVTACAMSMNDEVRCQADKKFHDWFG